MARLEVDSADEAGRADFATVDTQAREERLCRKRVDGLSLLLLEVDAQNTLSVLAAVERPLRRSKDLLRESANVCVYCQCNPLPTPLTKVRG